MNKKFIIIIILILVVIGGYFGATKYGFLKLLVQPSATPASSVDSDDSDYQQYLIDGMNYRTAGMQGDKDAYYKAINSYKKAIEISGGKVWIPYLNLGNTYREVQDYKNAEESYDEALKIAPGESMVYLQKIDLYRNYLKKSDEDINALYEQALKIVVDNTNLVISYAAFLRDTEKYSEALSYYKILVGKYPNEQRFKDEVTDLSSKIK